MKATRHVGEVLDELAGHGPAGGLVAVLVAAILVPPALALDGLRHGLWYLTRRRLLRTPAMTCGACRTRVVLFGSWRCSCKHVFDGHGFLECPSCEALSDITCSCQRTLVNPLRAWCP